MRDFICESDEECQVLVNYLDFLSRKYRGESIGLIEPMDRSLWTSSSVPQAVSQKSAALARAVKLDQWQHWQSHDRYALYKTAIAKNQPEAFEQVLSQLLAQKAD